MRTYSIILLCIVCIIVFIIAYILYTYTAHKPANVSKSCIVEERIPTSNGIIEIVDKECQEGLPHTYDENTIRLTRSMYESSHVDDVLIHERVHLDQKRNPSDWLQFYKTYWKYTVSLSPPNNIPHHYILSLRPNPDTDDSPWVTWNNRYVFFPTSSANNKLKDAKVTIWDLQLNRIVDIPLEWKEMFCSEKLACPHQYEHPHEISAEFLTNKNRSSAGLQLLRWYTMRLANK